MPLSTLITAILPPTDEWFYMRKRYNTFKKHDEMPAYLIEYFCGDTPDPTGEEMKVFVPFHEDYDEDLCETTFYIDLSDIPRGATQIAIKQFH